MKRLALVAALAAAGVVASLSFGSSHREAPLTSMDPTADDTDLYAFTAEDKPGSLTVVSNWIPFEDPSGGPNFYNFDPNARYYINVDNTGDGRADLRYRFDFETQVRDKSTYLYGKPEVDSIGDADLNVVQTYSIVRERYENGRLVGAQRIERNVPVAPSFAGEKTIPNYGRVAGGAVEPLSGGGRVFAGQRDDPFFIDLTVPFDALNFRPKAGTGNVGGGVDDVAGYGTHSIVLQVPERKVTRNHQPVASPDAPNSTVGVWSTTERRRLDVAGTRSAGGGGEWVQVSRLGNPLINEVVIPLGMKDRFNRTEPHRDAELYGRFVLRPELARLMNDLAGLGVRETGRTDIVTALLTGVPGLNQIREQNPVPADTLKINMGVPPSSSPSRFGVLAGDNAGFPNGRRLADDVVDIELRVIGGYLLPEDEGGKKLPLGDGVDQNDKPFRSSFPYVAAPDSANDSSLKRTEPLHEPTPGEL